MSGSDTEPVRLRMPSHSQYLPLVRAIVQEGAALAGFDEELTHRILLAVTEAVANVIRHVYNGQADQRIDLELSVAPDQFKLDIVDYGRFVDPSKIESRPLGDIRPGGLGVHLIKSTMDHVAYCENAHGGTTLTLVKHAEAHKEAR